MAYDAVEVAGLKDLLRTFKKLEPAVAKAWQAELLEIAEPVKELAQRLAGSQITNILSDTAEVDWWRMRIGVNRARGIVYIAPNQRGVKQGPGKRPNLAVLLETWAMQPAIDEKAPEIFDHVERMVDRVVSHI